MQNNFKLEGLQLGCFVQEALPCVFCRNNDERIEDHFKNFAEEGVSLLADYAARFSAVSTDVPLRPNRANRSRPDFHMEPLNPFCVACYQKVEAERQTFVLCDSCYAAWSRKVAGLYTTVESGPQLYATGKDGYVYGQAFPEAAADQNWKLRCIWPRPSGKDPVRYMQQRVHLRCAYPLQFHNIKPVGPRCANSQTMLASVGKMR